MRGTFVYMPILPARYGAFHAVATLSPTSSAKLTPMFDIRNVLLKPGKTLDDYLLRRVDGISKCWNPSRPLYIDVHDLPLEWRTLSGIQPVEFVVSALRSRGLRPIPVSGTTENRGVEYLDLIRRIAIEEDGVCLRLSRDELSDPTSLRELVDRTISRISIDPVQTDVVLDFRYVGKDTPETIRTIALTAFQVLLSIGNFRNFIVCGGSVPEVMTKKDNGVVRRQKRIELDAWTAIYQVFSGSTPIPFSDYGVLGPYYAPPGKRVQVPARIRYTTSHEHLFRRGKRNEHANLCEDLINADEFLGSNFSAGDQRLAQSAQHILDPGTPAMWVGYDTNHHLELVSQQIWELLHTNSRQHLFNVPTPNKTPWLQPDLLEL